MINYLGFHFVAQVDTPHGSSTVYVHGFGTDDSYGHEAYPGGHQAYGYGHIDPYLNHKQGNHTSCLKVIPCSLILNSAINVHCAQTALSCRLRIHQARLHRL